MRLLVAEDDLEIGKAIKTILERNYYSVDVVHDGDHAMDYIASGEYDGIIPDVMMPGMDGIEVLKELRKKNIVTPVMMLSAKGDLSDRVLGLDTGADDYLAKLFSSVELLAGVRALTRRSGYFAGNTLTVGNTILDCATYTVSTSSGSAHLNNKEFQLFEYFMKNPRKIFSTEVLIQHFGGWESPAEISVVWTNITNLRKKLSILESDIGIHLHRGAGYYLDKSGL